MRSPSKRQVPWLARHIAAGLLTLTFTGLATGGGLHMAGQSGSGNAAWLAVSICELIYAIWIMVDGLRKRRAGVDVIAVLALAGAVAVGEMLAAAVISVMLASGRALEEWAAGKARRDLTALLERAPREARRYRDNALTEVPLDQVAPGDVLLVAHGDVIPVDGTVARGHAVLDESALTGEPIPVEHQLGDRISSGVLNAGPPFDLLADTKADESTYAGIVRMVSEAEQSRPPFVRLADRYALWFLFVTLAAAALAWAAAGPSRAVAVLVVATPCPLILAAPVALVSGMSIATRQGVVVKAEACSRSLRAAPRCCWTRRERSLPGIQLSPGSCQQADGGLTRCSGWRRRWIRLPGTSWPALWSARPGLGSASSARRSTSRNYRVEASVAS